MATFFAIGMVDYLNSDELGYHEIAPIDMNDEESDFRRTAEVSNGRLAMLAFFELLRHDAFDGGDLIQGLPFLYN